MNKQAIKLEVTNSRNDDCRIEWFFCDTDEEKNKWIQEKKEEENKWNYHTPGAVSRRSYYFNENTIDGLLRYDISELQGMTLQDFITIIKNYV